MNNTNNATNPNGFPGGRGGGGRGGGGGGGGGDDYSWRYIPPSYIPPGYSLPEGEPDDLVVGGGCVQLDLCCIQSIQSLRPVALERAPISFFLEPMKSDG
jgi:hypothetical protein